MGWRRAARGYSQSAGQLSLVSAQGQPTAIHTTSSQVPLPHSSLQVASGAGPLAGGGAVESGQGANSQLGPTRPTELPSGHIFASSVQPWGGGPSGAAGPPFLSEEQPSVARARASARGRGRPNIGRSWRCTGATARALGGATGGAMVRAPPPHGQRRACSTRQAPPRVSQRRLANASAPSSVPGGVASCTGSRSTPRAPGELLRTSP